MSCFYLQKWVEMWRVKVHRCQIMPFADETVRRRPAYFLLLAHRDCLWKINQRFVVLLCFIVTVTYHINKVKLLDARSLFWLVSFPEGAPEKDGHFLIKAPFDRDHTIFSNTKGCNCAPPNTAVHFQDKYSCFLHISEVMERQHKALAAALSTDRH